MGRVSIASLRLYRAAALCAKCEMRMPKCICRLHLQQLLRGVHSLRTFLFDSFCLCRVGTVHLFASAESSSTFCQMRNAYAYAEKHMPLASPTTLLPPARLLPRASSKHDGCAGLAGFQRACG